MKFKKVFTLGAFLPATLISGIAVTVSINKKDNDNQNLKVFFEDRTNNRIISKSNNEPMGFESSTNLNNAFRIEIVPHEFDSTLNNSINQINRLKIFNNLKKLFNSKDFFIKLDDLTNFIFVIPKNENTKYSDLVNKIKILNKNELIKFIFVKKVLIESNKYFLKTYHDYLAPDGRGGSQPSSPKKAKIPERVVNTRYARNFASNNFDKDERTKLIEESSEQILKTKKRIKVGVLEVGTSAKKRLDGLIDTKNKYLFDKDIYDIKIHNRETITSSLRYPTIGEHSTAVASIIAGLDGINPNIELEGVLYYGSDMQNELDYLIKTAKVNIINMSFGTETDKLDDPILVYQSDSLYLDTVAKNNPETIFVKSAGNEGQESIRYLSNDSLAKNIFVVGSNSSIGTRSSFSTYGSKNNERDVTLLANGEDYNIFLKKLPESGTSYSTPFISGMIANTMYKYNDYYDYGFNNIIALSAFSSSTYDSSLWKYSGTPDFTNDHNLTENGAGTFDFDKLDQSFKSLKYIQLYGKKATKTRKTAYLEKNGQEIFLGEVSAKKDDILRGTLAWNYSSYSRWVPEIEYDNLTLMYGAIEDPWTGEYTPTYGGYETIGINDSDLNLVLKDNNGNVVYSSSSKINNIEFIKYKAKKDGIFKWYLVQNSPLDKNKTMDVAFTHSKGKN
ncbi:S8 family serine peptidase [Mycoplasmopsis columbina]|uniref:S8 family serine peptidase n=1 Tax=Mycoplasmopsis columbina TaxID=114881 RepID=UPI0004A7765A|nr:S8 family serine peptidase [Mycoplasmopsis columbina]VEU76885.1 Subtilase family [Mycoplasmopsis columbina]